MKRSDNNIRSRLDGELSQYFPASSFESVWNRHSKTGMKAWYVKKSLLIPVVFITAILTFSAGFATGDTARKADKIDYPFVNDAGVIGKWDTVDFVRQIEDFDPDVKSWPDLYLKSLAFIPGGKMLNSVYTGNGNLAYASTGWTKGLIISTYEQTAAKYEIKEIDGSAYMFIEWKNGDYVYYGFTPYYYVLKKVDGIDYTGYTPSCKEDNIDYPFIDDEQMKGTWEGMDFVDAIDQFDPNDRKLRDILPISKIVLGDNGELTLVTIPGVNFKMDLFWTKGLIINRDLKTAGKCEIREIDGKTYMFFEWKTGDYIYRDFSPSYYVFKKAD